MATGDLLVGKIISGSIETSGDGYEICSFTPDDSSLFRIELDCVVQNITTDEYDSFTIIATAYSLSGTCSILSGPTNVREEGNILGGVELTTSGNQILINTNLTGIDYYRIAVFGRIYQFIFSVT